MSLCAHPRRVPPECAPDRYESAQDVGRSSRRPFAATAPTTVYGIRTGVFGSVWHSRDSAVTCRRSSTRSGVGQCLQRALSSSRSHHTAHPCDRFPRCAFVKVQQRTFNSTPGFPRRLPAGRHGFAVSAAAQARGKTVGEAACGFSAAGWRANVREKLHRKCRRERRDKEADDVAVVGRQRG